VIENLSNKPLHQLQCITRSVRLRPAELHQVLADKAFPHSLKSNRPRNSPQCQERQRSHWSFIVEGSSVIGDS